MTTSFAVYDPVSGNILWTGWTDNPDDVPLQATIVGSEVAEVDPSINDATHYYSSANEEIRAKLTPVISQDKTEVVASGSELVTFSNIPNPTTCVVRRDGAPQSVLEITTGTLQFDTTATGIWSFQFIPDTSFHQIPVTLEVLAT